MSLQFVITLSVINFIVGVTTGSAAQAETLPAKLEKQWQHYDLARAQALENLQSPQQGPLTREKWEQLIALPAEVAFTGAELSALTKNQRQRISQAKAKAQQDSLLNLDLVRSQNAETTFCAALPKGGMLHVHPFGTLDRPSALALLDNANPALDIAGALSDIESTNGNSSLYPAEKSWLSSLPQNLPFLSLSAEDQSHFESFLFLPPAKQPFARFNSVFEFLGFAIADESTYLTVIRAFAEKAVREHVHYVEFTTSTSTDFLQSLKSIEDETGLKIRVNYAFNRTKNVSALDQEWKALNSAPVPTNLVGIDFLDNEEGNSAFDKGETLYISAFAAVMNGGRLHRTMHAGEIGDVRNPRDAMILGAERLGHGVNLAKDPIALEYAAYIHEPIEINLSSNLRLTDVEAIETHPYLDYLRLGLPVSLSTDDEGIFDIDINHECEVAIAHSDITYAELKTMAINSISTSFAEASEKQNLLATLKIDFENFEQSSAATPYRRASVH